MHMSASVINQTDNWTTTTHQHTYTAWIYDDAVSILAGHYIIIIQWAESVEWTE